MDSLYLWLKWLHLVSVISWMAALLYLPRLFVYHADCGTGSPQSETFKVMERRLYKAIMTPAMIASWLFGIGLLTEISVDWSSDLWLWLKGALVVVLSAMHGFLGGQVKLFARDGNERPARFFRIINEVPTVIMLAVVFVVVFKPF